MFEQFRSRCFINIDKFWSNAPDITACVRRHNMADDVVVKTFPADECLDLLEQVAPDIPYIPFLCDEDEYTEDLLNAISALSVPKRIFMRTTAMFVAPSTSKPCTAAD